MQRAPRTPAPSCDRCGAALDPDGACRWCGAPSSNPPAAPAEAAPEPTVAERLRTLRARPEYARLANVASVRPPIPLGMLLRVAFGLFFAAIAASMMSFDRKHFSDPFFDRGRSERDLFPALFVAVGLGIAAYCLFRVLRTTRAPLRAFPACVVGKRSASEGSEYGNRSTHHVGLEDERGHRTEYEAVPSVLTLAREDEVGVAFVRLGVLVAFRRVPGA